MTKCDVCGKRTIGRVEAACWDCRKWFAKIKSDLWNRNHKLWYKCREKGLL